MSPQTIDLKRCCAISWSLIIYLSFLVIPTIAETILIIYQIIKLPIYVSTVLISVWTFYGSFRFFSEPAVFSHIWHQKIFGVSPTKFRALLSAGYVIYAVPVWFLANAIAAAIHSELYSGWIVLAAWTAPIVTIILGGVIGFAVRSAIVVDIEDEKKRLIAEQQV